MTRKSHILKLICNVYGQMEAGQVWNKYMDQGMHEICFTLSKFDPCLYYHRSMVFLVYIDDCIVFSPDERAIDRVVMDLHACSQCFTVDDQGDIGDFLDIKGQKQDDGTIKLTQPQLIESIIKDLHLQTRSNPKTSLAVTTNLLHKDTNGPDMSPDFHYCSVIGKLNFLEKSTQPDISVSIHQCAHFSKTPKKCHAEAVKRTRSNPKTSLAVTTNLLHKDTNGPDMSPDFHYCSVIGKLNFLEKSTQPDISVSIHQCAHFSKTPKKCHAEAVKRIGQYLLASQDKGLIQFPPKMDENWLRYELLN